MIELINKKYLNSNFYKTISISEIDGYIRINIKEDSETKSIPKITLDSSNITEQIKTLDDYNKIKEIVLYFLRNNTIKEIKEENGKTIVSSQNRRLVLELNSNYKEIFDIIISKYQIDRLKFISNTNYDIVTRTIFLDKTRLTSRVTNYFIGEYNFDKKLVLTLFYKESNIESFDKAFIIEYVKELLDNTFSYIIVSENRTSLVLDIGRKIELPYELYGDIIPLVDIRNKEIKDMNCKQITLEGYYGKYEYGKNG